MNTCPKCGGKVDRQMVICPKCGEQLYNPNNKKIYEALNVHLIRWLIIVGILLPIIGFMVGVIIKKRQPMFYKVLTKNSSYGLILWCMVGVLTAICYLAMSFSGVQYF